MGKYDDIINLPHHVSIKHPQMSMINRAAQFSPFAALSGYDVAIDETARLTDAEFALSEDSIQDINDRIRFLLGHSSDRSQITIQYFMPDKKKAGGKYISVTGEIKKVKVFEREIELMDGTIIAINRILFIDGKMFSRFDE